jgi:hypothetical protein
LYHYTAVAHCTFRRHQGSVKAVSVRPDADDVFASCGRDGTIALWDVRESRRRRYTGGVGGGAGAGPDGEPAAVPTAAIERAHEPPPAMGGGTARGFRTRGGGGGGGGRTTRSATRRDAAAAAAAAVRAGAGAGASGSGGGGGGGSAGGGANAAATEVWVDGRWVPEGFADIAAGTPQPPPPQQQHIGGVGGVGASSRVIRGEIQHSVTSVVFAHNGQVLVSAVGLYKLNQSSSPIA